MRNLKDAYMKAHLKWTPDNEFQLKKDVGTVTTDVAELKATVNALKELISCTVTFDSDGGSAVSQQTVTFGHTATEPSPAPTKASKVFGGWFKGEETSAFDFSTPITANITLKAHWNDPV